MTPEHPLHRYDDFRSLAPQAPRLGVAAAGTERWGFRALGASTAWLRARAESAAAARIARRLHDGLAQSLTLALIQLDASRDPQNPAADLAVASSRTLIKDALRATRETIRDLQGTGEPLPNLAAALSAAAQRLGQLCGQVITTECSMALPVLPDVVAKTLFDAAHELLINACKHAPEAHVRLLLTPFGRGVQLIVQDDGPGFDGDAGPAGYGYGLANMAAWLARVGAQLTLTSAVGGGVRGEIFWRPATQLQRSEVL